MKKFCLIALSFTFYETVSDNKVSSLNVNYYPYAGTKLKFPGLKEG